MEELDLHVSMLQPWPLQTLEFQCGILLLPAVLDLNYIEDSAGGADVTLGIMPKLDKVTLLQMDAKLSLDTYEKCNATCNRGMQGSSQITLEKDITGEYKAIGSSPRNIVA